MRVKTTHNIKSQRILKPKAETSDYISFDDVNEHCPNCMTSRYANPNLKLYISTCFHKLYISTLTPGVNRA